MRPPAAANTSSDEGLRRLRIEVRGRLVEHEHRRLGEERAREHDPLALAARKLPSLLADERVEAVREALHPVEDARRAQGARQVVVARIGPGEPEVVADARREQVRVLARDGDQAAHVLLAVAAQVLAVESHAPALRVDEAQEQAHDGRLAGSAPAEQDDAPPRFEAQAEAVERGSLVAAVAGPDVVELDRERLLRGGERKRGVDDARDAVGQIEHASAGRYGRLQLAEGLGQGLDGLEGGERDERQQRDQHTVETSLRMCLNADREHADQGRARDEQRAGRRRGRR